MRYLCISKGLEDHFLFVRSINVQYTSLLGIRFYLQISWNWEIFKIRMNYIPSSKIQSHFQVMQRFIAYSISSSGGSLLFTFNDRVYIGLCSILACVTTTEMWLMLKPGHYFFGFCCKVSWIFNFSPQFKHVVSAIRLCYFAYCSDLP